jgi:hypothetical protein
VAGASSWLACLCLAVACGGDGDDEAPSPGTPPPAEPPPRQASAASPIAAGCTGGVASGTVYINAEVEPWLAVDPRDPNRLLATWQQDRWSNGGARGLMSAHSSDGGASWQRTLLPMSRCGGAAPGSAGDFERASDPWVDIGPDGIAYAMGLGASGAVLAAGSASGMLASRSADGGRTWSAPVQLIRDGADFFNDKNTLTADATAPGFAYAVWDRLQRGGAGPTLFARTADGGQTWDLPRAIVNPVPPAGAGSGAGSGISQTIGNRIVVATGGAERGVLVNVFTQIDTVAGLSAARIGVVRSLDKGQSWSAPAYIGEQRSVGTRDAVSGQRVRDGGILPAVAAGPAGELWVAWQDSRFTSGGTHDAIVIASSTDNGRTWSAPRAINRVPTAPAFKPVVHVRADGLVGVLHFDLRNNTADAATLPANAWLLTSRDGINWSETAVGGSFDMAFAPDAGGLFVGDYQGLASADSAFIALVASTNADTDNRTDVRAPRFDALAAASVHAARGKPMSLTGAELAKQQSAHHAAIVNYMQRRIPSWRTWSGAMAPP